MISGVNELEDHVRMGVQHLEPMRVRWLLCYLVAWVVLLIGGGVTYAAFTSEPQIGWVTAGVSGVIYLIVGMISSSQCSKLHNLFDSWREAGVRLLDGNANYSADQGLAETDFQESGLIGSFYNRYSGSHFLSVGDIRSSGLSVKHVYTQTYSETEYYTDSQGHNQSRQVQKQRTIVEPVFDGLLLVLPAELPHSAWVVLRHRDVGVPNGVHRLTVASPYLVKHYAVGASDPFAGHRTLTPTLMEALWDYRQQFKYTPGYSYRSGLLYITVPNYWLDFGRRPGKWVPVTTARLTQVVSACGSSIEFLKSTAAKLVPT